MPYRRSPVGISIRDHKLAALFFEQILAFGPRFFDDPTPKEVLFEGPEPEVDPAQFKEITGPGGPLNPWNLAQKLIPSDVFDVYSEQERREAYAEARAIWYAGTYSLSGQAFVPLIFSPRAFAVFEGGESDALQVLITGFPFVDTSKAKWAQILDLRKRNS